VLDDQNLREVDLSTIDTRALTAADWEAVKREVLRRARAERAAAMRQFFKRFLPLRSSRKVPRRDPEEQRCMSAVAADKRATPAE
jgi:hypothetical protein